MKVVNLQVGASTSTNGRSYFQLNVNRLKSTSCPPRTDEHGLWAHASRLGIEAASAERAVRYLQWSSAAEKLALHFNGTTPSISTCGRARMPKLQWKSLATKSSALHVEHIMWQAQNSEALAGCTLYATLWATISTTLRAAAAALVHDEGTSNSCNTYRWISLRFSFYQYSTTAEYSPLWGSLKKLKLEPSRWLYILTWPLGQPVEEIRILADEAVKMAKAFDTLSAAEARSALDPKIAESLAQGDAWLHKYI